MKIPPLATAASAIMLVILFLGACATPHDRPAPADDPRSAIRQVVASLYLASDELRTIYLDMRAVSNAHAFLPDDKQLNHVQKAALYVEKAYQNAHHQWELFSIMEYIKPSAAMDYYTLRHASLRRASDRLRGETRFLKIYRPFIASPDATADIDRALGKIDDIQTMYARLLEAIAPMVRNGLPTSV